MLQYRANFLSIILVTCITAALSCQMIQTGVSPPEKAVILEAHNRLRSSVAMGLQSGQPNAENMKEVVWDDELAQRAQGWANQCTFKHDPQRTSNRFTMGQNMAIIWSTAPIQDGDFNSRIGNWFREVNQYAFGSSWSPKTGHYSQLVWAETNMVGCGYSYYKDGSNKFNKLFVCNYGPGGNVVGSMPYSVGNPDCNRHGLGSSNRYPGLCSSRGGGYQSFGGGNGGYFPSSTFAPSSTFRSTTFAPSTYHRSSTFAPSTFRASSTFAPSTFASSTFAPRRFSSFYPKSSFAPAYQQPFHNDFGYKGYFNSAPKTSFAPSWNALPFGLYKKK